MTELLVNTLSTQHSSHTLGKEEDNGRLGRKNLKQGEIKLKKRSSENWLDQRLKSEASQHQTSISGPEVPPQRQ